MKPGDIIEFKGREAEVLQTESPIEFLIFERAKTKTNREFRHHILVEFEDGEYGLLHEYQLEPLNSVE